MRHERSSTSSAMSSSASNTNASSGHFERAVHSLSTREVGCVFGKGTDPCRFAGEVARLPGALVEGPLVGNSPESEGFET